MARSLMFMGTGSDVGKSLIVAGLCRAYANRGLGVAPFKPQNMSNNAGVTADGGEIGRAQMLQARAARRDPTTAMNPILLKPEHETGAQVIVRGRRLGSMPAAKYMEERAAFLADVRAAFAELSANADLVLVEGAGSASEVNLRQGDIANFGFARAENVPVVVIGDIERGGVIASLVGTFAVIDPEDAALIAATLVNKFQGDPALFEAGRRYIAERTGVPCLGPVPMFADARKLPAEDSLGIESSAGTGPFRIVVPRLPRIANFDDLDPFRLDPGVSIEFVGPGRSLPTADLIILPGSKATRADLAALIAEGWDIDIRAHYRAGRPVFGICGGFQMLGNTIADPLGIEGEPGTSKGLGLLDVDTKLGRTKQLREERAVHAETGKVLSGYHMHMGETTGPDRSRPFVETVVHGPEGATSRDGLVTGTYLHGYFGDPDFRAGLVHKWGGPSGRIAKLTHELVVEQTLDALATHLEQHLDLDALLALAR